MDSLGIPVLGCSDQLQGRVVLLWVQIEVVEFSLQSSLSRIQVAPGRLGLQAFLGIKFEQRCGGVVSFKRLADRLRLHKYLGRLDNNLPAQPDLGSLQAPKAFHPLPQPDPAIPGRAFQPAFVRPGFAGSFRFARRFRWSAGFRSSRSGCPHPIQPPLSGRPGHNLPINPAATASSVRSAPRSGELLCSWAGELSAAKRGFHPPGSGETQ